MEKKRKVALLVVAGLMLILHPLLWGTLGCGSSQNVSQVSSATVTVPDLTGMTPDEAREVLEEIGLAVGEESSAYSDTVPEGRIITSRPAHGEAAEEGEAVDLVVSKGRETVALSDLTGKAESEAIVFLQGQGLQVKVERRYHEKVAAGLVCAMDPPPGTSLTKGSTVTLSISLGSAYVTCGTCKGTGRTTVSEVCPECGGTGLCPT